MGKKDMKHKKKTSHKKKHKKEHKKKQKEKKYKHYKSSSSSDSNISTDSGSPRTIKEPKHFMKKTNDSIQDDISWDDLFSEKNTISKIKKEPKKELSILDIQGQSARELNPYWKDGGNGLPPANRHTLITPEKSYDIKSLKKLLQQAKDTAQVTGIPLAEIIQKEWGSWDLFKQIIENSENGSAKNEYEGSVQPDSDLYERRNEVPTEGRSRRLNFMKPGEGSHSDFTETIRGNWKKKNENGSSAIALAADKSRSLTEVKEDLSSTGKKSIPTVDDLNALTAKKIKAEIMGNNALAEKLEKDIENAKMERKEHTGRSEGKHEKQEIILVTKSVQDKLKKPSERDNKSVNWSGKRQRCETHEKNERLRHFMNDDKHSLKSMFQREKLAVTETSNEFFLKLAKKGKFRSMSHDDDLDDDFLDRIRSSDYERNEIERERNRAMNEARAKHKTLSHCRWCLEGNNMQEHLIISTGTKCYLCLPSYKSLTNGHCLIVPVHHETCGSVLDEDVWNEMHSFRNRLCRMFQDAGQDVIFFENARSFNRYPHMVLHCVPMDKEIGDLAPIYFKKAILDSEIEWSNNKKLIDLRNKDLRRSVPKGLPYFAVDFGRDAGFAHVIEDEKLFPSNFAEEIIGGMLDLDATNWRKHTKESLECQKEKVKEFIVRWKKYEYSECNNELKVDKDSTDSQQ